METKEQCKNCEIINADCEGCKEFNKNIRNSDSETKEQKIERLKLEIENRKGTREFLLQSLPLDSFVVKYENEAIARLEQELKGLENGGRNSKNQKV